MKVYHVSEKVKKLYIVTGIFFVLFAIGVLIIRPVPYVREYLNLTFYVFVIGLAWVHITRHRTYRLCVDDSEIYYNNGLLNSRHIPLDSIAKIEYKPGTRIVVHTNRQKRAYRLLNVIEKEDLAEFMDNVKRTGKKIQIVNLEKPVNEKGKVQKSE